MVEKDLFWAQPFAPTLPTAIGCGLSYYEQMQQLFYHTYKYYESIDTAMDSLIAQFNALKEEIQKDVEKYTDYRYNLILAQLEDFKQEIALDISQIEKQHATIIEECKNYTEDRVELFTNQFNHYFIDVQQRISATESHINLIYDEITTIHIGMEEAFISIRTFFEQEFKKLKAQLSAELTAKSGDLIAVYNPVKEKYTSLNQALKDIVNFYNYLGSLAAIEYDNAKIPAAVYDDLHIPAIQYDLKARFYLQHYLQPKKRSNF